MKAAKLIFLCLLISACAPNRDIEQSQSNVNSAVASTPSPTPGPPPKITVADLINRVVNVKPDAFLYPCDLNSQGDANRAKLRDIRAQWLAKEQDDRYLVAPDYGCVCPSICVLTVEDTQKPAPKNFALLVLEGNPPGKLTWLAKDLDLSNTTLSWLNATPQITFKNPDNTTHKICSVDSDQKLGHLPISCTDPQGRKLPSL
jgi:hypothetical protein